jgi:hypothetical protein
MNDGKDRQYPAALKLDFVVAMMILSHLDQAFNGALLYN